MRAADSLHRTLLAAAWLALLSLATPACAQADAGRRVALVVGNNAYANGPLLNPVNDAKAMAAALQSAGFNVILKLDARQSELLTALREFGVKLKDGGPGTAGLFYFAGHGMQIKGRNFLIPVGANIEHEDELAYQALDAQAVMDKMESAGNGTNIVILDACRNNPFVRSFRSNQQGLAQMDAPVGTVVAFSTAPGSVASDGTGRNGLYTSHLLAAMKSPGRKVEEVFKQVRIGVLRDSAGKQTPWEFSSLVGDFYFSPGVPGALAGGAAVAAPAPASVAAMPDPTSAIDDALWAAVKDSTSSAELFAYLNRFPAGRYAKDARAKLADLVAPPNRPGAAALAPATRPNSVNMDEVLRQTQDSERDWQAGITAAQERIDEIVLWGDLGTARRTATPKRNANHFAEGDRYRWRVLDQTSDRYTRDYLWRIDRIDADGSLWVNDGAQRLDAMGQLKSGSDEATGQWVDWLPALPITAAKALPLLSETAVSSTVQWRNAEGRLTKAALNGKLHGPTKETIQTLAGLMDTLRLDAYLSGPAVRSNGERVRVTVNLSWWFAAGVGLPVRWMVDEREDDRLLRRTLHDITALDVLSRPAEATTASK